MTAFSVADVWSENQSSSAHFQMARLSNEKECVCSNMGIFYVLYSYGHCLFLVLILLPPPFPIFYQKNKKQKTKIPCLIFSCFDVNFVHEIFLA